MLKGEAQNWSPWLPFVLRSLKRRKDHLAVKVESLSRFPEVGEDVLKILEHVARNGRITTRKAEALTGAPRPTVKARLGKLVEQGRLVRHGAEKLLCQTVDQRVTGRILPPSLEDCADR